MSTTLGTLGTAPARLLLLVVALLALLATAATVSLSASRGVTLGSHAVSGLSVPTHVSPNGVTWNR